MPAGTDSTDSPKEWGLIRMDVAHRVGPDMAASRESMDSPAFPGRGHRVGVPVALGLVSLAAVLTNTSWFGATAVVPALERQ